MLFLSFFTSGLNEWCGDTWLAWWNQPLSNTRTRCPCNRVPKQSAGLLHGLAKCLGLMTPWQPCLQKIQGYDCSPQRAAPSGNFGWLLYMSQLLLWQKCWTLFASVLAKKAQFLWPCHISLTGTISSRNKWEKKKLKSSMPTVILVIGSYTLQLVSLPLILILSLWGFQCLLHNINLLHVAAQ